MTQLVDRRTSESEEKHKMKFANRMDRFGEGVFSMLAQMKKKKLEEGEMIVDLSIGAPNIAPAPHILKALSEACLVP